MTDTDHEKAQLDKFKEAARQLECDEDEAAFEEKLKKIAKAEAPNEAIAKICPECGHTFKGNGWDGIDAHWRSKHDHIMPYEEAWPLLKDGRYVPHT